jgi:phosphatidylserine/phosphatidylglycerophosphate/cardiolipin synthase-like enzyme
VGSTNLNLTGWLGNWELDVAVEDEPFAKAMEAIYLDDLSHATDVVLTGRRRVRLVAMKSPRVVAIPLSVMLGWVALSLFFRAATLRLQGHGLRWPWRRIAPPEPTHTRDN